MRTMFGFLGAIACLLLLFVPWFCFGVVIKVPQDYGTIQQAIDSAVDGDEIIVAPETYFENINFSGKNVVLHSTDPTSPTIVNTTVIDGNSSGSVVTFSGNEVTTCVLSGFTISNGKAGNGGGIIGNGTRATITHNHIKANMAEGGWPDGCGGGLIHCDGTLTSNTIYDNSANRGGGLYQCHGTIQNNSIFNNAIQALYQCDGTIENNTITDNSGDGLSLCDGTIQHNTISHNSGDGLSSCDSTIQHNTISNNSARGLSSCDGTIQFNTISSNSGSGVASCDGIIQYNTISGNSAEQGGGLDRCDGTIQHNDIFDNSASFSGGGLYLCDGLIQYNSIWNNTAARGGGLDCCDGTIQGNILYGNLAVESSGNGGGGLYGCDASVQNNIIFANSSNSMGGGLRGCLGTIRNCIIWQNSAPTGSQLYSCESPFYCCIQDWYGEGIGNISEDPQLLAPGPPPSGDFHLLSSSPCIDSGCFGPGLTYDFEGDPVPYNAITWELRGDASDFDIGIDEFIGIVPTPIPSPTPTATPSPTPTPIPTPVPSCVMYVPQDYATIQEAIDAAQNGCLIVVAPGRYVENVQFKGKDIILTSTEPTSPTVVFNTIIDGDHAGSVVTFAGTEASSCVLSGFTIIQGYRFWGAGGGIYGNGTLATIQNNVIWGNSAEHEGGGLYRCNAAIHDNTIARNWAGDGGGLFHCQGRISSNRIFENYGSEGGGLCQCSGTILDNAVRGNFAGWRGAGLFDCDGSILNNTISDNSADWGAGLSHCDGELVNNTVAGNSARDDGGGLHECDAFVQNNTIVNNTAEYGGGVYACGGTVFNSIIWANSPDQLLSISPPLYSCIQDWTGAGAGNISSDPQFVDAASGNYHLQPGSPCIDAGNTFYLFGEYLADIDGECRVVGDTVDMGNDEYGSSWDSDGDLLADSDEAIYGSEADTADTDTDGLVDGVEVLRGTNPTIADTPPGITIPAEYPTIQEGLFLAFPSEEIIVTLGTYYENLHFLGKDVTLQGTNPLDDDVVSSTILDGSGLWSVIMFRGTEDKSCVVKGFTIRNGAGYHGGAIRGDGSRATIAHNRMVGNLAGYENGVLYSCDGTIQHNSISGNSGCVLYYCDGIIEHNVISGNSGYALSDCQGTVQHNIISANSGTGLYYCHGTIQNNSISEHRPSGLYDCDGLIQNNVICRNTAPSMVFPVPIPGYGGGLYKCDGTIQNNTIWGNRAGTAGGGLADCGATIRNCIIWQNHAPRNPQLQSSWPTYSCIQDWTSGGEGNVTYDPQLVDPANDDFHLQPFSPCIDAGGTVTLTQDFEGDPRPYHAVGWEFRGDGSGFDMGADEFIGTATSTTLLCHYDFTAGLEGWSCRFFVPSEMHVSGWDHATSMVCSSGIGLCSPYDETTNYYALWDSFDTGAIPYYDDALYQVAWVFSTDRQTTNAVPSLRFRIGLDNHKAFAYSRLYPGDWLPLVQHPETTEYRQFFEPPIASNRLFLAFSLIDWASDFRESSPAGAIYLEEVTVTKCGLWCLTEWYPEELSSELDSWTTAGAPPYTPALYIRDGDYLVLASGIDSSRCFGSWDSPAGLFTVDPINLYRLTLQLSSSPQLGGPELRVRVHTDDYRYSWYTHYVGSYTPGESALPPEEGADYPLYLMLPFATQPCRVSFDVIDFYSDIGGTLTLQALWLDSHPL